MPDGERGGALTGEARTREGRLGRRPGETQPPRPGNLPALTRLATPRPASSRGPAPSSPAQGPPAAPRLPDPPPTHSPTSPARLRLLTWPPRTGFSELRSQDGDGRPCGLEQGADTPPALGGSQAPVLGPPRHALVFGLPLGGLGLLAGLCVSTSSLAP